LDYLKNWVLLPIISFFTYGSLGYKVTVRTEEDIERLVPLVSKFEIKEV